MHQNHDDVHKHGHSHDFAMQIDDAMESHKLGIKALKITLIVFLITATFQLIIALYSGSVGLLADSIHNYADACTSIPLWIAFALTKLGPSRRFTYGFGKTEDIAGVAIVMIILVSAGLALYETIQKLLHPSPMTNLGWAALAALIAFCGNEIVAIYRIKVGKKIGSAALIADGYHARMDGLISLAVLLGVAGSWLGYHFVDPLVGIGITIAILFIVKDVAKSVWIRLIDGIEPEILEQIEHAPMHVAGVTRVHNVRARWIGHRMHAEVTICVDPNLTVREADLMAKKVEQQLHDHLPALNTIVVHIHSEHQ